MLFWNLPSCPKHLGWLQKKHMMAGQNKCKEKEPDCHIPIKMLKLHATPGCMAWRFIHQKGDEKLVKDEYM